MLYISSYNKYMAIMLIPALLSCGGAAHKGVPLEQYDLSVRRAMNIDWSQHEVRLIDIDGTRHTGYLDGWTQQGFIIENKSRVDTVAYSELRNYFLLHSDKTNTDKGFYYGLAGGAGVAALASLIVFAADDDDNSITVPDDSFPPMHNDLQKGGEEVSKTFMILVGTPVILAVSAAVGSIIGSKSKKYERYYFKADEFKASPWQYKTIETKRKIGNLN